MQIAFLMGLPIVFHFPLFSTRGFDCSGKKEKRSCLNGFTVYMQDKFQSSVPLAGETNEQCRRRILQDARVSWSQESQARKEHFSTIAKNSNKQNHSRQIALNHDHQIATQTPNTALSDLVAAESGVLSNGEHLSEIMCDGGIGCMGCGDEKYGLAAATVKTSESETPSFVTTMSSRWRNETNGISGENKDLKHKTGTIRLSCLEQCLDCNQQMFSYL